MTKDKNHFLGPPPRCARRRYALGLAVRSALRRLRRLGLAFGHPAASLGRLAFGHGGFAACCRSVTPSSRRTAA